MKYFVTVKPGASREEVVGGSMGGLADEGMIGDGLAGADGVLTVYLRAKPHDGEANAALVRVLAKYFGVGKTRVVIVSGAKGRKKVVEVVV